MDLAQVHAILYPTQRIWSLHLRVERLKVVINTGLVHERTLDSQSMILTDAKFCAVKFIAKLVILLSVENQICPLSIQRRNECGTTSAFP